MNNKERRYFIESLLSPLRGEFHYLSLINDDNKQLDFYGDREFYDSDKDKDGHEIYYEKNHLGTLEYKCKNTDLEIEEIASLASTLARQLAPNLILSEKHPWNLDLLLWVESMRNEFHSVSQWIGIYFFASYFLNESNSDLVLGPFIGAPTDHVRIPLNRGICGLALSSQETVNVEDVKSDSRYLACSIETKSELVVPLKGPSGEFIAELDIDCHHHAGFSPTIQNKIEQRCHEFTGLFHN